MDTAKKGKVKEYFQNLKRQLFKDLEYLGTVTSIVSNSTRKDATEEDFEFLIYDMKKCLQQDNTESLYINQTLRKVMQSKNLYHIYRVAYELQDLYPTQNLLDNILQSKDPRYNWLCAKNIKDVDRTAHCQEVVASRDSYYNYCCARDVESADIQAHGQVIIDNKNPRLNYMYARDIKGANMLRHGQVLLESKHPKWNFEFAKNVKGADKYAHGTVVKNTGDKYYISKFEDKIGKEFMEPKIYKTSNFELK